MTNSRMRALLREIMKARLRKTREDFAKLTSHDVPPMFRKSFASEEDGFRTGMLQPTICSALFHDVLDDDCWISEVRVEYDTVE